ncbi:MAG: efflux RND transporter periplasmic adaptor subunit [Akkermansiaceae bacterium]|nr:efflux RND transporter periplasmic adaptor subunit [Armatimonadota bacterium]
METLESPTTTRRKRTPVRGAVVVWLVMLTIAGLIFAANTYARQREGDNKRPANASPKLPNQTPTAFRTVTALAEDAPGETQALSGILEARRTVTVSAEIAARITARPPERGDRVTRGETVAAFDDRTARASVAEAQAALSGATANRKQAEAEYARARTETASAIDGARATLSGATAGEKKARSFTRTQELRQSEAALSQAETDEKLAKIERDRYARLVAEGAVAQQTLDRTQATYDSAVARTSSARESVSLASEGARQEDITQATAQVSSARANLDSAQARPARLAAIREQIESLRAAESRAAATLENARVQLAKHRIVSPVTGRVLETRAEAGEYLAPGTPIAVLSDVRDLRAVFAIPEAARPLLAVGKRVTITTDALPGKSFPARVAVLGFQGDGKTRTFRVEVAVANPGEVLLPNMTARLSLPIGNSARRVTVPVSAIATDDVTGGAYVVTLGENNDSVRRPVILGEPVGADRVRVKTGLSGGERLAADPARVR